MIIALVTAGLLEGIGIAALLPLITILTESPATQTGKIAKIVDSFFSFFNLEVDIATILIFIVIIMIIKAVITMTAITQVAYTSAHVTADLRKSFLQNTLKANWLHYLNIKSGAGANALGMEAYRAALSFRQGCTVFALLAQIAIYALIAAFISWKLTLSALLAGSVIILLLSGLIKEARKAGNEQTLLFDNVLARITESLHAAKPLKAMNKGDKLALMMEEDINALQSTQRRLELTNQSIWVLSEPLMLVFIALGLYAAMQYSQLPTSELLFLAVVFLRLVMRLTAAQRSYQSMAANESALWGLLNKINRAKQASENFTGTAHPTLNNQISLQNISYAYGRKPVLTNISMTFAVKKLHLIYGGSGAGKTTLVDLITGLLSPDSGDILIDDQPLSNINLATWRQMIGYVPQEVFLFHDTVYNNITLNDPSISHQKVEEALQQSEAFEFVHSMNEGLNTIVGERGAKLSGGQRQRLALARAIVHKPSLLILDEATSALDSETEKAVLKTVKSLTKKMTILAISHNPSLEKSADHVYCLQNGHIEEKK